MNDITGVLELSEAVQCEWYLMCTNTTLQAIEHPVCGYVPCCVRCQMKTGLYEQIERGLLT